MAVPNDKKMISFVMSKHQKSRAERIARIRGYTFSSFLRQCIEEKMNELENTTKEAETLGEESILMVKIKDVLSGNIY